MKYIIFDFLAKEISAMQPEVIPNDLGIVAEKIGIKGIYFFEKDLSEYRVYGNCIVSFIDGYYTTFSSCRDIRRIIEILHDEWSLENLND
jgi:hypothetical protein